MAARNRVDYDRIEAGWRAGLMSPRQLAAIYTQETGEKVSHAAIIKHFTAQGIPRDLAAKIKAKSDAMVTRAMVTEKVTPETRKRDREIVDDAADVLTGVRLAQRKDIHRTRSITMALLEELEQHTGAENVAMLQSLGDMLRDEDEYGRDKLNDLYQKIISLPGRAKTMKDLGDSLRVLVALERQAFGLDDKDNRPVDALTSLLNGIASTNGNGFATVAHDPEHDDDRDDD